MKNTLLLVLCGATILGAACATLHKSDLTAFQGKWKGRVLDGNPDHTGFFVVAGNHFDFHTADSNVWYKGTFSLREDTTPKQYIAVISECPFPQYVGKTGMAIYQVKDGVILLTGNEPGNPAVPASFDAPDAARIELKRE